MKVSRLAVLFSVLFFCFVSVALAQSGIGGWITRDITLNIRSGPGTQYGVVKMPTSSAGIPVWLDGRSGDSKWYHSGDISGVSGWFSARFFEVTEGNVSALPVLQGEQAPPAQADPTTVIVASGGNSTSCWQDVGHGVFVGGHVPTTRGFDANTISRLVSFEAAQFGIEPKYGTTYLYYVDSKSVLESIVPGYGNSAAVISTAALTADGCGLQEGSSVTAIVVKRFVADAAWTFGTMAHELAHDFGAIHGFNSFPSVGDADRSIKGIQDAYYWTAIGRAAYEGTCDRTVNVDFCHLFQMEVLN